MSNEQKPSVGHVVHYVAANGERTHLAATIAHVNEDGTVNLGVLNRYGATFPRENVTYNETDYVGTWHWPERV